RFSSSPPAPTARLSPMRSASWSSIESSISARRPVPADKFSAVTRGASTTSRTELCRPGLATVGRLDQRVAGWLAARRPANLRRDELEAHDALRRSDRSGQQPVLATVPGGDEAVALGVQPPAAPPRSGHPLLRLP